MKSKSPEDRLMEFIKELKSKRRSGEVFLRLSLHEGGIRHAQEIDVDIKSRTI